MNLEPPSREYLRLLFWRHLNARQRADLLVKAGGLTARIPDDRLPIAQTFEGHILEGIFENGRGDVIREALAQWLPPQPAVQSAPEPKPAFPWIGELEDDCTCAFGGLFAHAECMGEITIKHEDDEVPETKEYWWAAVYEGSAAGQKELWSTNNEEGFVIGGPRARELCQWVMRAILAERAHDPPIGPLKNTPGSIRL